MLGARGVSLLQRFCSSNNVVISLRREFRTPPWGGMHLASPAT